MAILGFPYKCVQAVFSPFYCCGFVYLVDFSVFAACFCVRTACCLSYQATVENNFILKSPDTYVNGSIMGFFSTCQEMHDLLSQSR